MRWPALQGSERTLCTGLASHCQALLQQPCMARPPPQSNASTQAASRGQARTGASCRPTAGAGRARHARRATPSCRARPPLPCQAASAVPGFVRGLWAALRVVRPLQGLAHGTRIGSSGLSEPRSGRLGLGQVQPRRRRSTGGRRQEHWGQAPGHQKYILKIYISQEGTSLQGSYGCLKSWKCMCTVWYYLTRTQLYPKGMFY